MLGPLAVGRLGRQAQWRVGGGRQAPLPLEAWTTTTEAPKPFSPPCPQPHLRPSLAPSLPAPLAALPPCLGLGTPDAADGEEAAAAAPAPKKRGRPPSKAKEPKEAAAAAEDGGEEEAPAKKKRAPKPKPEPALGPDGQPIPKKRGRPLGSKNKPKPPKDE